VSAVTMADQGTGMRGAWDRRAENDALYGIEASRRDWTHDEFFEHGRGMVAQAMEWLGDDVRRGRMLDVGCGLGRTAVPFAAVFEEVDGVDISRAMVERAVALGLPPNVRLQATSGADLAPFSDGTFDLVFSEHVFQHIPAEAVIAGYIREIGRVLKAGGVALLQFDTRPVTLGSRLVDLVPDRLLPRKRRRYMRRYRRDRDDVRAMARAAGLTTGWERGERSHWHWFMLRRDADRPAGARS
jgi:SAM-dependent methyltransferase